MNKPWYEIWADERSGAPYILIALSNEKNDGGVSIVDPRLNYEVVHEAVSYDEAMNWLTEDEFTLVTGRMPDDDD